MPDQSYTSDQPISSKRDDRFNRWPFAVRVADTIANRGDPSSLIVAIYGPWGDGKTSVLKMIEEQLASLADVIVVPFNPWYFEDQPSLIRAFFQTIADALGAKLSTRVETLGGILQKYGSLLSAVNISGVGVPDASKLGETLSNVTLDDLRGRIEAALTQTGQRLVVLLDDIDRLDRAEIQLLFKLIKLSAGFQHVSYVLAFDDEVVADSLGERYGAGGINSGRRFLEKIVQVPLHLPPADRLSLRQIAFEGVDAALRSAGLELSESDGQIFGRRFIDGLEPRLITPRQAKRYGNAIAFAIPILSGEVHPVDQLLIEGIRVFYPVIYETVRRSPDIFLGTDFRRGDADSYEQKVRELFDGMTLGLNKTDRSAIENLLSELFPKLQSVFANTHYGDDHNEDWDREQRICTEAYFDRYFRYAIPPRDISDRELKTFLDPAAAGASLDEFISRVCAGHGSARLIAKLRRVESTLSAEAASRITLCLAKAGECFPVEKQVFARFASTRSQAAILIINLLKRIADPIERCNVAKELALVTSPIPFALDWFWWARPSKDDQKPPVLPQECLDTLGCLIAARIEAEATATPPYTAWPDDAPSVFWLWKAYGRPGAVMDYLLSRFSERPHESAAFLTCFVPTAWGLENGLSFKTDFAREQYNSAVQYVTADRILTALEEMYGDAPHSAELYQTRELPVEFRVARQFSHIHACVLNESEDASQSTDQNGGGVPQQSSHIGSNTQGVPDSCLPVKTDED